MPKIFTVFTIIFLIWNAGVSADTIFFKDGTRIDVKKVWEDGDAVKAVIYGEIVSFQASDVKSIKKEKADGDKSWEQTLQARNKHPVLRLNKTQVIKHLKKELSRKYPGSYHLQKSLLDSNMEAYRKLKSLPPTPVNIQILNKLVNRYYPYFHLIQSLYQSNIKAYRELNN